MPKTGFYNSNANRSYPFVDFDDRRAAATGLIIPDSVIVDFGCLFGMGSGYVADEHKVWLHRIERAGGNFIFDFRTDVAGLENRSLEFRRTLTDGEYEHEFAEADLAPGSSIEVSDACGSGSVWEGFLITGSMEDLQEILPADGQLWVGDSDDLVIEPAVIQNLDQSFVSSVNLANAPRTFAPPPDECSLSSSVSVNTDHVVNATCLVGPLKLVEGYNCAIRQDTPTNRLTISAAVGAGEGEPCDEVPLYAGEVPLPGSNLFSGGPKCDEIIKSISGLVGPLINLRSGTGVTIDPDPDVPNRLLVTVTFRDMAFCPVEPEPSSLSSSSVVGAP